MKFRKKPVVIEAMQLSDVAKGQEILEWINEGRKGPIVAFFKSGKLIIPTLEGNMACELGDWVIKGIKGEFYPCKPDIFSATYEKE